MKCKRRIRFQSERTACVKTHNINRSQEVEGLYSVPIEQCHRRVIRRRMTRIERNSVVKFRKINRGQSMNGL